MVFSAKPHCTLFLHEILNCLAKRRGEKSTKVRVRLNHNVIFCLFLANEKADNVFYTYLLGHSVERKARKPILP